MGCIQLRYELVKRTRKEHRCVGCRRLYPIGSRLYAHAHTHYGDFEFGYTCIACDKYIRKFVRHDETYYEGDIKEMRLDNVRGYLSERKNRKSMAIVV